MIGNYFLLSSRAHMPKATAELANMPGVISIHPIRVFQAPKYSFPIIYAPYLYLYTAQSKYTL
jgi:hypothetical protein